MQQEISKVIEWATKWKMKVNGDKTKAMVFSTSTNDLKMTSKTEGTAWKLSERYTYSMYVQ